jgi:pyrimidine-nucleoside phosphorylase
MAYPLRKGEGMHFLELILKKRNGHRLSTKEIDFFISEYVKNNIPDYQVSALLMAIWFSKMDVEETCDLTFAMRDSGEVIDLSAIPGIKVDKHSTGGVADTTTLIAGPLAAACGVKVAKISGRGLGHTGGTIDKLESIPGLSTDISMESFIDIVSEFGLSIIGQTRKLVPADKLLYALRDVTGTIDNTALIASSIISKKLASGADAIVLDVKTGNGAFMESHQDALELARLMVNIGKIAEKKIITLVTDMNQPLGNAVGNALEVREAIEILQGRHEGDLKKVAVALAAKMLIAGGAASEDREAIQKLNQVLDSGLALNKLARMIESQGGDPTVCQDTARLPEAGQIRFVKAAKEGYIREMLTGQIGLSALLLGAGRMQKAAAIDPAVGIWMKVRKGNYVEKGTVIAEFHVNDTKNLDQAIQKFQDALILGADPPPQTALIHETIGP